MKSQWKFLEMNAWFVELAKNQDPICATDNTSYQNILSLTSSVCEVSN
jgi:hypothetical protein